MRVRVNKAFYDRDMRRSHSVGDTFEVSESRLAQIESTLPGYVTVENANDEPSIKELREMALAKGIKVPRGASRAKLVELLAD